MTLPNPRGAQDSDHPAPDPRVARRNATSMAVIGPLLAPHANQGSGWALMARLALLDLILLAQLGERSSRA
jgi:hypothetical protein